MSGKKLDIEVIINSTNINDSIIELDDYICSLCNWGDNIPALTYPQMVFYFNQELEREVNNGGFNLYFHNSSGSYSNDTVATLTLIKANKTAKILEAAIAMFPDSLVPRDNDLRIEIFNKIETDASTNWEILTDEFLQYQDDLNYLNMEFIKENKRYF